MLSRFAYQFIYYRYGSLIFSIVKQRSPNDLLTKAGIGGIAHKTIRNFASPNPI